MFKYIVLNDVYVSCMTYVLEKPKVAALLKLENASGKL